MTKKVAKETTIKIKWPTPNTVIKTKVGMEYIIGSLINSGGYALIYEGRDNFWNSVAIKIFKPANRKFGVVKKQWEKETWILRKTRHPNIVAVYDAFICDNLFYIVLEKAWGSLEQLMSSLGKMDESKVKEVARQLLFALGYIHRENILHKDLTIYNVLVFIGQNSNTVKFKISDFGISEEFLHPWEVRYSTDPTAHRLFRPPELVKFGYTNQQSDLYHLGLILFYCLTGDFPYDIKGNQNDIDQAILNAVPRKKAESLGTSFSNFISILLRRGQKYRFQTAIQTWDYLKKIWAK